MSVGVEVGRDLGLEFEVASELLTDPDILYRIAGVAMNRGINREDIGEVQQEVALRILNNTNGTDVTERSLPQVSRVANNTITDMWRKNTQSGKVHVAPVDFTSPPVNTLGEGIGGFADMADPVDSIAAFELNSVLTGALSTLPAQQREIVRLRFLQDQSVGDVAARLGIPEGTVKSNTNLAIKKLRAHFTPEGETRPII